MLRNTKSSYSDTQKRYYQNVQGPRLKQARTCTDEAKELIRGRIRQCIPEPRWQWFDLLVEVRVKTWRDYIRLLDRMMYYKDIPRDVGMECCKWLEDCFSLALERTGSKKVRDRTMQEELNKVELALFYTPPKKDSWIDLPRGWEGSKS